MKSNNSQLNPNGEFSAGARVELVVARYDELGLGEMLLLAAVPPATTDRERQYLAPNVIQLKPLASPGTSSAQPTFEVPSDSGQAADAADARDKLAAYYNQDQSVIDFEGYDQKKAAEEFAEPGLGVDWNEWTDELAA